MVIVQQPPRLAEKGNAKVRWMWATERERGDTINNGGGRQNINRTAGCGKGREMEV